MKIDLRNLVPFAYDMLQLEINSDFLEIWSLELTSEFGQIV